MFTTPVIRELVEKRIAEAQQRGEFDELPGAGRPQRLDDDRYVPPELRMGLRILRNADCVPPALEARREFISLQQLLAGSMDFDERTRLARRISLLAASLGLRLDGAGSMPAGGRPAR